MVWSDSIYSVLSINKQIWIRETMLWCDLGLVCSVCTSLNQNYANAMFTLVLVSITILLVSLDSGQASPISQPSYFWHLVRWKKRTNKINTIKASWVLSFDSLNRKSTKIFPSSNKKLFHSIISFDSLGDDMTILFFIQFPWLWSCVELISSVAVACSEGSSSKLNIESIQSGFILISQIWCSQLYVPSGYKNHNNSIIPVFPSFSKSQDRMLVDKDKLFCV